jgi:hypothetical protein
VFDEEEAYSEAIQMMLAGAQPFCLVLEDGLHVMSVVPTSRAVLAAMIHDDLQVRMAFTTGTAVALHDHAAAL